MASGWATWASPGICWKATPSTRCSARRGGHIRPAYERALAGEESHLYVPYEGREYLNWLGPLMDSTGAIVAGMGFTHDVTEVRRSQRALLEESRRLRDAESIGRVGSWELDLRSQAVNWSDGIFDLYGLDA